MKLSNRTNGAPLAGAVVVAALAAAAPGLAAAQGQGPWLLRAGVTVIQPQVTSGDLTAPSTPRSQADIEPDTQPSFGITYLLGENLAIDLPLSAGVGKLAEVRAMPVTLMLQWRFGGAADGFRPYAGIGPTYARFSGSRSTAALTAVTGGTPANPTTFELESKWTVSAQLGVAWRFAPRWQLDASVWHTPLKTEGRLSTGQTLSLKADPLSVSLGAAYRF